MTNSTANALVTGGLGGGFLDAGLGQELSVGVYVLATLVAVILAAWNHDTFRNVTRAKEVAPGERIANNELDQAPPSFSRISGLVGVAYLTAFCWGLGLFILINIWAAPDAVAKVISASGDFIMTGSALFAPYAFNQLSQIFGRRTPGGGSTDPAKPQYAVKVDRNQMLADVDPD